MGAPTIISATLGLSPPWRVTQVDFSKGSSRLDISVEIVTGNPVTCPVCRVQGAICYLDTEIETWRHNDYFHYTTYLHARVPHLACSCGVAPVELPWCRAGSGFAMVS